MKKLITLALLLPCLVLAQPYFAYRLMMRTNFVSGQVYTNTTGRTVLVSAKSALTVASVSGAANLSLEMPGNETNTAAITTIVGTIAMSYTNSLVGIVTNGGTYAFTNRSTGAGNSATVSGGQIFVY